MPEIMLPLILLGLGIFLLFLLHPKGRFEKYSRGIKTLGALAILAGLFIPSVPTRQGVVWTPYDPALMAQARAESKPVILYFYADWCMPCHTLARYTFSDAKVVAALEPLVRLKADMTDTDDEDSQALMDRFGIMGVPSLLFFDASGQEIPSARIPGFADPGDFLAILKESGLGSSG